jgi:Uma2 family endonuclease
LVNRLIRIYGKLSNGRWQASAQNPLRLDDHSEPEPDFMLLKPSPDDYTSRHPRPDEAFLLVEVADASLDYDLEEKLPAYGHAGVAEVWIVNLRDQSLEVYREPHFTGYGSKTVVRAGDTVAPLAFPDAAVDVAELLKK